MPDACVVFGCKNSPDGKEGIGLHPIPFYGADDPQKIKTRKKWVDFVQLKHIGVLEANQILGFVFEAFPRRRLHSEVFRSNWAQSSTKIAKSWSLRLSNCPYSGCTVCRREQVSCVSVCSDT